MRHFRKPKRGGRKLKENAQSVVERTALELRQRIARCGHLSEEDDVQALQFEVFTIHRLIMSSLMEFQVPQSRIVASIEQAKKLNFNQREVTNTDASWVRICSNISDQVTSENEDISPDPHFAKYLTALLITIDDLEYNVHKFVALTVQYQTAFNLLGKKQTLDSFQHLSAIFFHMIIPKDLVANILEGESCDVFERNSQRIRTSLSDPKQERPYGFGEKSLIGLE
ncbi:hypothetical protein ACOMHN_014268 [Nucella lapillus]